MSRIRPASRSTISRLVFCLAASARACRIPAAASILAAFFLTVPCAAVAQTRYASPVAAPVLRATAVPHRPVQSEIVLEGLRSFGHFHMFAYTWWSSITTAGIEYDRHSWGYFAGAQMDYVAEFLPVVLLNQPSKTDVFGDPIGHGRQLDRGIGIEPIGLRMMWRSNKAIKPYLIMKGGLFGFTRKALSSDASYLNFSLQIGLGVQFHLRRRLDMRVGYSDLHFSDAFMVPSNPGLDSMAFTEGLCYHFGGHGRSVIH